MIAMTLVTVWELVILEANHGFNCLALQIKHSLHLWKYYFSGLDDNLASFYQAYITHQHSYLYYLPKVDVTRVN
jgi:hypothetical protein